MESDLSFVYMTCLLNVPYNLMKYHKYISKGLRVMACMGDNSRTESVRVVILVCDTPTQCPLQLDQVSCYLKGLLSYGLHKIS